MLRRLKAEVEKGLPPKKEMNLYVPLSQMQVNFTDVSALADALHSPFCFCFCVFFSSFAPAFERFTSV